MRVDPGMCWQIMHAVSCIGVFMTSIVGKGWILRPKVPSSRKLEQNEQVVQAELRRHDW